MSRLRSFIAAGFLLALLPGVAHASHSSAAGVWYYHKWKDLFHDNHNTGLNVTWRFSPGFPNSAKRDRVKEAFAEWNGLGQNMKFERLADATENYTVQCADGPQPYHGIFYGEIDDPGGVLARTHQCVHFTSNGFNQMHGFSIKFDHDENWHGGLESGGSTEHDFGGAAAHEVGHASGGWTTETDNNHWPSDSGVCDGTLEFHTMCRKRSGEPIPRGWRWLEEHDRQLFKDIYPP